MTTIVPEKPKLIDPREKDVLYDSDLIMAQKRKDVDEKAQADTQKGW